MGRFLGFLVAILSACDSGDREPAAQAAGEPPVAPAGEVQVWRLSRTPLVTIGVVEGDPEYELSGATSSLRLGDGRLVIANTGSAELRFFDAQGRFLARAGGQGGGPGEFRLLRRIHRIAGDSVAGLDWARASVFDADGRFVRTADVTEIDDVSQPLGTWLRGRFWITHRVERYRRTEVEQTLDRLPIPDGDPPYRVVHVAESGRLWIGEPAKDGIRTWTVVGGDRRALAVIDIPVRFDIHEIGSGWILGRSRDENDVDFIVMYGIERESATRPLPRWLTDMPPEEPARTLDDNPRHALTGAVRTLVIGQEQYYASNARYAHAGDVLPLEPPAGIGVAPIAGHRTGWLVAIWHVDAPVVCGVGVGSATPLAWSEATLRCGT